MATYTIGSGGDYATITLAEAALTLPEAGGTIYNITGTVVDAITVTTANYANGLTIQAVTGEEADGLLGGAFFNGLLTTTVNSGIIDNLNIKSLNVVNVLTTACAVNNCDIGNGTVVNSMNFSSVSLAIFTNTIFRDGATDCTYSASFAAGVSFIRCSAVDASRIGFIRGNVTDCFGFGSGTNVDFFADCVGDYIASEDTSANLLTVPATNNFTGRTSADFNNYATGDFNLAAGSSLTTAGSTGGRIGAYLTLGATISVADAVARRGQTDYKFTLSGGDATAGTATINGQAITITTYNANGINTCTIPNNLASVHGNQTLLFTDAASGTPSTTVSFLPIATRDYINQTSPQTDILSVWYGYSGSTPVTGDELVFDTATSETSIVFSIDNQGYWTSASVPLVHETVDIYAITAAGVIGSTMTFTLSPDGLGSFEENILTSIKRTIRRRIATNPANISNNY